jgi:hypothetical protein
VGLRLGERWGVPSTKSPGVGFIGWLLDTINLEWWEMVNLSLSHNLQGETAASGGAFVSGHPPLPDRGRHKNYWLTGMSGSFKGGTADVTQITTLAQCL